MGIYEWNAVFVLVGGNVVCSGCMAGQKLQQSEENFPHSPGCKHDDEDTKRPWRVLHKILDCERG